MSILKNDNAISSYPYNYLCVVKAVESKIFFFFFFLSFFLRAGPIFPWVSPFFTQSKSFYVLYYFYQETFLGLISSQLLYRLL